MDTQLRHGHQPVRVIRSAASTYTDRPAQPWLADRQSGPARRLKEFASGNILQSHTDAADSAASNRAPGRNDRAQGFRNHTTSPIAGRVLTKPRGSRRGGGGGQPAGTGCERADAGGAGG